MSDLKAVLDPEQLPEEPDEDPDFDPDDDPVEALTQSSTTMAGGGTGERDWEYRTEVLSVAEVADGKTLIERLTQAATDNWHLVEIIDAGESRVVLLRRSRNPQKERRSVGFAPPGRQ
jgi:hypothetical protein